MKLPKLAKGHRWVIKCNRGFGIPEITARIKSRWGRTLGFGRGFPQVRGVEGATKEAVQQAYTAYQCPPHMMEAQLAEMLDGN